MTAGALTLAVPVAVLAGVTWCLRRRYAVVAVQGRSMRPTYRAGDRLLVRRTGTGSIRRGQVVVFAESSDARPAPPAGWIIKRAIAVPGDPVPQDRVAALRSVTEEYVPAGRIVVIGDNPALSFDSRHFGYVTGDRVLGVVLRHMRR
jgi:signal peptidase I